MKIYISLPITGQNIEQVEASCIFAKAVLTKKGHEAVSPLDIQPDPDASYQVLMGNCIRELLTCDGVVFLSGWKESKGCNLEQSAAAIYGKHCFYSLEKMPEASELWHVIGKEEELVNENFNL